MIVVVIVVMVVMMKMAEWLLRSLWESPQVKIDMPILYPVNMYVYFRIYTFRAYVYIK